MLSPTQKSRIQGLFNVLSNIPVLFKPDVTFKDSSRKPSKYKYFSSLCKPCYMSAHILLNLLNKLRKSGKMGGLSSILSLFGDQFNKFNNKVAWMIDSVYHMMLRLFFNHTVCVKMLRFVIYRVGSHVVFIRIHCTEKCQISFHNNVLSRSK